MAELWKRITKENHFFEILLIILIPLYSYKFFYEDRFNDLIQLIKSKFKEIEVIIEFVFYMFFFYSFVILAVCLFLALIYKPVGLIYSYKFKNNEKSGEYFIENYFSLFYGSQNRASFVFRWLLLIMGYLYIINPKSIIELWDSILIKYESLNWIMEIIIFIPIMFYGLLIFIALLGSYQMLANKFLKTQKEQSHTQANQ
ncbi:hypothetical protein [Paenibacillus pabuli]|uniref:hypothetical protein n=1 Tax=Paenibacillus pabuli TaxID=1472 RepID=UPI0007861920|nr:hypothetical protein [Paenibacillus pabuli]MEC0129130.1 hypothetical protein [Paenibacillus pabuli]